MKSDGSANDFFPGFTDRMIEANGVSIRTRTAGSGQPLLLLHGYPQTQVVWHKMAKKLTAHFSVVMTDLRGYGDSSKPDGGEESVNYSHRVMAQDQVEVMRALGFERFGVAGHDRGGRVAHRMALDFPQEVLRLAVLDIAPTLTMYERADMEFAKQYVWWFFHIQKYPMPERMIGADPEYYLSQQLEALSKTPGAVTKEAMAEYLRCFRKPETIHAGCEDYRAAAGIGLRLDAEDAKAGRKVTAPLLALWGAKGAVGKWYDVLAVWRERAADVRGRALDCGHQIPEELPDETVEEFVRFFGEAQGLSMTS
jgi:haloacetate dehalogenase